MAQFKFDKNSENLDFSLGGDLGANPSTPVSPPIKAQPQLPVNPQPKPAVLPPAPAQPQPSFNPPATVTPSMPAAQPAPALPVTPVQPNTPQFVQPQVVQPEPNPYQAEQYPSPYNTPTVQPAYVPQPQIVQPEINPYQTEQYQAPNPAYAPYQQPTQNPQNNYAAPGAQQNPNPQYQQQAPEKVGFFSPRPKKEKPVKVEKERKSNRSAFSGKRKVVLYSRLAIAIVLIIVSFSGLKSIFFPAQFPSQAQVISVVKTNLGITNFPIAKANGFVVSFATTYFTYDSSQESARSDALAKYISSNLLHTTDLSILQQPATSTTNNGPTNVTQTVVGEPVISEVNAVDDNNAVYTVEVTLSTGTTLYVQVPIYYDSKTQNMAVSAPLAIVPPVSIANVPATNHAITWSNDTTVVSDFQTDLSGYLTAWANSDQAVITRYTTTDATLNATKGLGGSVKFGSISSLSVQAVDKTTIDPKKRQALVTVVWVDAKGNNTTYTQSYLLNIVQQSANKWFVQDITGTIISTK